MLQAPRYYIYMGVEEDSGLGSLFTTPGVMLTVSR